jgi:hypothetical protein
MLFLKNKQIYIDYYVIVKRFMVDF